MIAVTKAEMGETRMKVYDWDAEIKLCSKCRRWKDLDEYHTKNSERGTYESQCKECRHEARAERYKNECREKQLKQRYNIDEVTFRRLLKLQGGCCAICGFVPNPGENLCVDHDHGSGMVRGLLCWQCNLGIAHLQDNPMIMRRAARYIVRNSISAA